MKYISVCSGIGAETVAWHPLGWNPQAFSEIEEFPRALLQQHYPTVPLHGDFTTIGEDDYGTTDLLVGGTPCQDFSIAGLRKGIAGARGNLTIEFLRLATRVKPRWVVWENVPGVLSIDSGRAFGAFLGGLAECGYGFAYRVLDAQYFGVPQRRRRVFVIGYFGDWRPAAAILFERESLQRDITPIRGAGQTIARTITTGIGSRLDGETDTFVTAIQGNMIGRNDEAGPQGSGYDDSGAAFTLTRTDVHAVAYSETFGYKGIKQRDKNASTQKRNAETLLRRVREEIGEEAFTKWGLGILDSLQPTQVLRKALHGTEFRQTTFSRSWVVYCALSREEDCAKGAMQSLREAEGKGCASQRSRSSKQFARELGAYLSKLSQPGTQAQKFLLDLWGASEGIGILRKALSTIQEIWRSDEDKNQSAHTYHKVRKLVPIECEFLQGFPRNYTLVPFKGKMASDSDRYKALGNSMHTGTMRWLGERINMVEGLLNGQRY